MSRKPGLASASDCAYFRGVPGGTCTVGCWQEPSCITEEPTGGWLAWEAENAREQAWEASGNHGMVKFWRDVMRHFEKREARSA